MNPDEQTELQQAMDRREAELSQIESEKLTQLKHAINNLLWVHLPGRVTLDTAEDLAVDIFEKIRDVLEESQPITDSNLSGDG